MTLTNFLINSDTISLSYNDKYLDLHNNFDFRSFVYDVTSRQLELVWTRSHEDWSNESICAFKLVFRSINFLKIRERDSSLPVTEDYCLSLIGFLPQNLRDDFDSFVYLKNVADTDDLNIAFQGEQAFKINSNYADFVELNEEIIYVPIINEGTQVWRPMWADRIEEGIYKIKSFINYNLTEEDLQFKPGETVICERQKKSEGNILVAVNKK